METEYAKVQAMLTITDQMRMAHEDAKVSLPRGEIYDLRESIARIRIEGLFLDEAELDELRKSLGFAVEIEQCFAAMDETRYGALKGLVDEGVRGLGGIVKAIDRVLDRYGKIADNASPELARIRREITNQQGSVSRTLAAILRQAKTDGYVDSDAAPTIREGRLVIPVSPGFKRKIGGIVHDESATGKTVYVEPQQVVDANNKIRELEGAERRERIRILREVTDYIRPQSEQIMASQRMLAEVDFLNAKVSLAQAMKAIRRMVGSPTPGVVAALRAAGKDRRAALYPIRERQEPGARHQRTERRRQIRLPQDRGDDAIYVTMRSAGARSGTEQGRGV